MAIKKEESGDPKDENERKSEERSELIKGIYSGYLEEDREKIEKNLMKLSDKDQHKHCNDMFKFVRAKIRSMSLSEADQFDCMVEKEAAKTEMTVFTEEELRMVAILQSKSGEN